MNHNQNAKKKFAALYLKQGIFSFILLGLTICLTFQASLMQVLFPTHISSFKQLASADLDKDNPEVEIHCDTLYYTGYDNYGRNGVTGHYYYSINDNYCLFFLMDSTGEAPKEVLTDYRGVFHMTENPEINNQLIISLAKELGWSSGSLRKMCLPLIASQPDHHALPIILLSCAIVVCLVVFLVCSVHNFLHYQRLRSHITDDN